MEIRKSKKIITEHLGSDFAFNIIGNVVFIAALFLSLCPLIWMILNGFRSNDEIFSKPIALPLEYSFKVFSEAWNRAKLGQSLMNSIINSFGTVFLTLLLSSPAAYVLARMRFFGRNLIIRFLMSSIIISGQLVLIPLFFIFRDLGIYNTLLSTIVGDTALYVPISIIFFYNFFCKIPLEIEEAAKIDGCGRVIFYFMFILPLSKAIHSAVIIFTFLWSWNEYLFALTFLKTNKLHTIPLCLTVFCGQWKNEYNLIFATLTISIVPLLVLYIFLQKSFIKGLTAGAVKM